MDFGGPRWTSVPSGIEHRTIELDRGAFDGEDGTDVAARSVRAVHRARRGTGNTLLFVSSSSKYLGGAAVIHKKLKQLDLNPTLLSDALWPTSNRAQKRKLPQRLRKRVSGVQAGADASKARAKLNENMRTSGSSRLLVADTAATRGLHLDDVSTVLVLGQPSNFEQYLHLAGRTGRWPRREFPGASVVVTLAKEEELNQLSGWCESRLGDAFFEPFELPNGTSLDGDDFDGVDLDGYDFDSYETNLDDETDKRELTPA